MIGKQRVREIMLSVVPVGILNEEGKKNFELALDSIEEVVKEVLGEDTLPEEHELSRSKYFTQNNLRSEQLGRWESK